MGLLKIILLAIVQGLAELLPVSSSAHVIVAARLMEMPKASDPRMTLLLVMLHTGTMFAVIGYFWKAWRERFFASWVVFKRQAGRLILATLMTGLIGYPLMKFIERVFLPNLAGAAGANGAEHKAEIEMLFARLDLIAPALAVAGILILVAGLRRRTGGAKEVGPREAAWMGAVQGLCLPFRGFSRSGATISVGLLAGGIRARVEEFSFALAVIITPAAIGHEVMRVLAARQTMEHGELISLFLPSMLGMVFSFLAGVLALRWLSGWLEKGRWYYFGLYCLAAAAGVQALYLTMGNN